METISKQQLVPCIVGPTCVGKTSLALRLAKELDAHILSIDSRQIYRELNIGTGKIRSYSENLITPFFHLVDDVKIYGYDLIDPDDEMNVIEFCEYARDVLKENKKIIITCGTGFYLNFLTGRIKYGEIDIQRKEELNSMTLEGLLQIYSKFEDENPIDLKNKTRIVTRILSLESSSTRESFDISGFDFRIYKYSSVRNELYLNADFFVEEILQRNVIGEYLDIYNKYGLVKPLKGLIYKEIGEYLNRRISSEELAPRMKFSVHAYIRRQLTYFNKLPTTFSSSDKDLIIEQVMRDFLEAQNN